MYKDIKYQLYIVTVTDETQYIHHKLTVTEYDKFQFGTNSNKMKFKFYNYQNQEINN